MTRRRLLLVTAAAFLVDALVLVWLPLAGVRARVLPTLVFLVGAEQGPDRGAGCGLLAGGLCFLAGASPWQMALLTLLGAAAGGFFPRAAAFWGKWLTCLLPLAALEGLLALGHWVAGQALLGALSLAGREFLLSAACFPLAFLLLHLRKPNSRAARRAAKGLPPRRRRRRKWAR